MFPHSPTSQLNASALLPDDPLFEGKVGMADGLLNQKIRNTRPSRASFNLQGQVVVST